ncbi:MAG: pilus assembly protein PilM [Candidatus Omnitrophota bacterium]
MNYLGIYFGVNDINLVEVSGKKILNNIRLPHPNLAMAELEEKVPADIKIMAMLKDAFRTYHISAKEAFFCISGQDLVIRTFEIPLLPQNELKGAVNFEAKKYIPFKLEELDYDFQVLFNKKNKTSLVLFVGIKKEILANYVSIAKQLSIKVDVLEYSVFSILRFLKLAGASDAGVMATLCYDLNNDDEANFTVFENGFSLFSRDFALLGEPAGFEQTVEASSVTKREKLKNEIKVSLDYYNRKFPDKEIKNILTISDKESRAELSNFFAESTIPVKFIDAQKALGRGVGYSSVLVKSFATALFKSVPIKIKINLIGSRLKAAKAIVENKKPLISLEGFKIDFRFIILGIVVCAAAFGYGLMRIQPMQEELTEIKGKRLKINSAVASDSLDDLSSLGSKYRKKIAALDSLVKNQIYATYPLNAIPSALPDGVWLETFNLTQKKNLGLELILNGEVYLDNSDKEFESVNIFLLNLKKSQEFGRYFKEIIINSIDQRQERGKNITVFSIICRNFSEKK